MSSKYVHCRIFMLIITWILKNGLKYLKLEWNLIRRIDDLINWIVSYNLLGSEIDCQSDHSVLYRICRKLIAIKATEQTRFNSILLKVDVIFTQRKSFKPISIKNYSSKQGTTGYQKQWSCQWIFKEKIKSHTILFSAFNFFLIYFI